jgi:hypothetical protein
MFKLEASAADILQVGAEKAYDGIGGDTKAGLVHLLFVDQNTSGEDEGLCPLSRSSMAVVDK